jgi:hypothetical protein
MSRASRRFMLVDCMKMSVPGLLALEGVAQSSSEEAA